MVSRFKDFILSKSLFTKRDRLILALSGGVDSVSLFHLLRLSGYKFEAAHVNYGLRGKDSEKDERFVKDLCSRHNIECHLKKIPPEYWIGDSYNVQNEARKIRYHFFDDLIENKNDKILIAHNQDDNLETVLMNFTRGTGISGMTGISPLNGNIIRPILFFTRKELETFLIENNFKWREDESNASYKYKRNRFRHIIIPELKKENPALMLAFDRYTANINPVNEYYLKGLKEYKKQNLSFENGGYILRWRTEEERDLFLFAVLFEFGFNPSQVDDIKYSISISGKYFDSNTHRLTIDRDCILIRKKRDQLQSKIQEFEILEATKSISKPLLLEFSISENVDFSRDSAFGQFDFDKLIFPLILRKWKSGDKMKPLGLGGEKKISDILIDIKIALPDKENIYVLESNGKIVWLIGLVIDEDHKIRAKTKRVWSGKLNK